MMIEWQWQALKESLDRADHGVRSEVVQCARGTDAPAAIQV